MRPNLVYFFVLLFVTLLLVFDLGIEPLVRWRLRSNFKQLGFRERRVQGTFSTEGIEANAGKEMSREF